MISPEKIAEMLAAAAAATPGPWGTDDPHIVFSATGGAVVYLAGTRGLDTTYPQAVADAKHIALCGPETITAILSELLTLRAERDEAREAMEHINALVKVYEDEHPRHVFDGHLDHSAIRTARAFYLGYWDSRAATEQSNGSAFADAIGGGWDGH